MSAVDLAPPLTSASWEKKKTELAKDKAVAAKLSTGKVADALKALNKLHDGFNFGLLSPTGITTSAAAADALKDFEAAVKGPLKDIRGSAKQAEAAADAFAADAEKLRKTVAAESAKVVVAAMGAAKEVSTAASAFDRDLAKTIDSARADLQGIADKLKAQEKKGAPAAGNAMESKAGKLVRVRALETIRKIKKPQPGAKPPRFIVVSGKTSVTVYMGPTAGTAQEKILKGLIASEKPFKTYKDPKGEVIWEKGAVTLVSDRLPMGLAKKMQAWLKKLTKINARIRIRKTSGEVDESDEGEDISDEALKPDAAEVADAAARKQAGKDFTRRLATLGADIKAAMAGPMAAEVKTLVASITKLGGAQKFEEADAELDEIEALLEEAKNSDAASSGIIVAELAKARQGWSGSRTKAISEIKRLAAEIGVLFKDEAAQKAKVGEAVTKLYALIPKLDATLETQIDAVVSEKDAAKRTQLANRVKITLDNTVKLLEDDELMSNLDNNEVDPDMKIVEPMLDRLAEIEAALG